MPITKELTSYWAIDDCNTEERPQHMYNAIEKMLMHMFKGIINGEPLYPVLSKSATKAMIKDCIRFRISHGEMLQRITVGETITNVEGEVLPADYISYLLNTNEQLIQQLRSY
jgi:hypothetical protein